MGFVRVPVGVLEWYIVFAYLPGSYLSSVGWRGVLDCLDRCGFKGLSFLGQFPYTLRIGRGRVGQALQVSCLPTFGWIGIR